MSSQAITLTAQLADAMSAAVDRIAELNRRAAAIDAQRAIEIVEAQRLSVLAAQASHSSDESHAWSTREAARRSLTAELACALRITENAAMMLITASTTLVADLPATLSALSAGSISWRHAQVVTDQAESLPASSRLEFEEKILSFAQTHTVSQFNKHARIQRERMHPESIDERHETAVEKRSVSISPAADGMAWMTALLPAESAHAIFNRLTDAAEHARRQGDLRTIEQLRADALCDGLLVSTGSATDLLGTPDVRTILATIRPTVHVTVPILALLDQTDLPAMLNGYGPIDPETAALLAANAPNFIRLLTHPESGAVLSVGREKYTVTAEMRRWLQIRDGTCRFPGCGRTARRCDIDHTDEWQYGGDTAHNNLAHLCRKHHRLKSLTDWAVEQVGDGVLQWTSPTGKIYKTEPEEYIVVQSWPTPEPPASTLPDPQQPRELTA